MKFEITEGDVFDAIFPPEKAPIVKMRSALLTMIQDYAREKSLTQHQLSKLLDVPQSRVSDLMRGKLSKFNLEMLLTFVFRLGLTVELTKVA